MNMMKLAEELCKIKNFRLGYGPDHPSSPRSDLSEVIESFVSENTFLRSHPDYIDFLREYAGGGIYYSEDNSIEYQFLTIYGFDPSVASDLYEEGVELINLDGFFVFCETQVRVSVVVGRAESANAGLVSFGFAFDATSTRVPGVYRSVSNGDGSFGEYTLYCDSFTEWLKILIRQNGRFI